MKSTIIKTIALAHSIIKTRINKSAEITKSVLSMLRYRRIRIILQRRLRLSKAQAIRLLSSLGAVLKRGWRAVLKALRALYKTAKKTSAPMVVAAAATGSTIRKAWEWLKAKVSKLKTRHTLFIATSVPYRDALAGAMALIAALIGVRKEIATLLGMAVSSLQRFFAQRAFIDDTEEDDEGDEGDEGPSFGWRPSPAW